MNSSAFTVAVVPIIKEFRKTATEASYLSEYHYSSTFQIAMLTKLAPASLQVLGMGFGALIWVGSHS